MSMAAAPGPITPVDRVLDALHAAGKKVRQSGPGQWHAQCPAHNDREPSLSIHATPAGKVLLNCHALCRTPDVAQALGLAMQDLFPDNPPHTNGTSSEHRQTFTYLDETGEVLFRVLKFRKPDGTKTFRAQAPDGSFSVRGLRQPLYNLPHVLAAIADSRPVILCEGEKDAESAQWLYRDAGGIGTTKPFGAIRQASEWRPEWTETLRGAHVIVFADDDVPGRLHADLVTRLLDGTAASVRTVLPAEGCKDLAEHYAAGKGPDEARVLRDVAPPEHDALEDDWAFISLGDIARKMVAGEWEPVRPTVLAVEGAMPLFYPGRINSLFGESGGGKSLIALHAAHERMLAGERVLFVDYEDRPDGIAERLLQMGATPDEIDLLDYSNPVTEIGMGLAMLEAAADERAWTYAVIDSTGEAMSAAGINSNDDGESARWFALVKKLTRLPSEPCVIVLDHVVKDADAPKTYAIGSQRKRAAVTGASYRVDTLKEPAKGKDGKWKLTVAKDRLGNRARGATAAIIELESIDPNTGAMRLRAHLTEAQEAEARGERFRPTVLMEKVSRWLEDNPGSSGNAIEKAVDGNNAAKRTALSVLIDEGWVIREPSTRGFTHRSNRPFRELDSLIQPVDRPESSPTSPTSPNLAQTSPGARSPTSPTSPTPLQGGEGRGRSLDSDGEPRFAHRSTTQEGQDAFSSSTDAPSAHRNPFAEDDSF